LDKLTEQTPCYLLDNMEKKALSEFERQLSNFPKNSGGNT
jgi:hypothetical protein